MGALQSITYRGAGNGKFSAMHRDWPTFEHSVIIGNMDKYENHIITLDSKIQERVTSSKVTPDLHVRVYTHM